MGSSCGSKRRGEPDEPEAPQNGRRADLDRLDLEAVARGAQHDIAHADHAPALEVDDLTIEERLAQPGRAACGALCRGREAAVRERHEDGIPAARPHGGDLPRLALPDDPEILQPLARAIDCHGRAEQRAGQKRRSHACRRLPLGLQGLT